MISEAINTFFSLSEKKQSLLLDKIERLTASVNEAIKKDWSDHQPYEVISAWPVDETRTIEGTINKKVYEDKYLCVFTTMLPPGTTFPKHWHDGIEYCIIIENELSDREKKANWKAGEVVIYRRDHKHKPFNPSKTKNTKLLVVFVNPLYL